MKKVSIIGAGNIGSTLALIMAMKELSNEIYLLDIYEGPAKGKALDIMESSPILKFGAKIYGTASYEDIKNSDLYIITAGFPRKPGMTREDLLFKNYEIIKSVCDNLNKVIKKDSKVIVVTNPLDIMTYVAVKTLNLPQKQVMGMAGVLDSARFAYFISEKTGISVENIKASVIGGHGDDMVPLVRYSTIAGLPLEFFLKKEEIEKLVERTRKGGTEIVNLLGTGSAYFAPAASIFEMSTAILQNKRKVLPCSVYLEGKAGAHYDAQDLCVGVPVILGKDGVEEIILLDLNEEERKMWKKSVDSVRKVVEILKSKVNL